MWEALYFSKETEAIPEVSIDEFIASLQLFIGRRRKWRRKFPRATIDLSGELIHLYLLNIPLLHEALLAATRKGRITCTVDRKFSAPMAPTIFNRWRSILFGRSKEALAGFPSLADCEKAANDYVSSMQKWVDS